MYEINSRVIPILALISLGYILRFKNVLQDKTITEMKKFTIDFALASVLLKTFATMEFKKDYYILFFLIFIFLCLTLYLSYQLNKIIAIQHPLLPFITSGCSLYLVGVPLFSAVYGIENVGSLTIIGIGHEFYVWLMLYAKLGMDFGNEKFSIKSILGLLKTPTMLGVILGCIINISGLMIIVNRFSILKGLFNSIEYLSTISTPLILIIIGYGLKLNKKYLKMSLRFLIIRLFLLLSFGYLFKSIIIDTFISSDIMFNNAYFIFLILPLPLSIPLIVGRYSTIEYEELANNTVVMSTIVSIFIYIGFIFIRNIILT